MEEALTRDEVARIAGLARRVGRTIGWELGFRVLPASDRIALTVEIADPRSSGARELVLRGPVSVGDLGAHDIELDLEALERGDRVILVLAGVPTIVDPHTI